MKKLLSIILSIAVMATMFVVPVMANDQPTVTVASIEEATAIGEEVKLAVSVENNPGFTNFDWVIDYDTERLSLNGFETGFNYDIPGMGSTFIPYMGALNVESHVEMGKIAAAGTTAFTEASKTLFNLIFTVKENAPSGIAEVSVVSENMKNDGVDVEFNYVAGTVNIDGIENNEDETPGEDGETTGGNGETTGGSGETTGGSGETTGGSGETTGGSGETPGENEEIIISGGSASLGAYVARPVASIPSGKVEAGTKVELSTRTKDAVIYYTVDGTIPSAESTLYSGAITITEDTTIKAIAIKEKAKSSVLTVKYTIKESEENPDAKAPAFTDISNYAWANEAIAALAEIGIIKGISDTEFAPANNIRRADFMLLLVRILDLKAEVTSNFDDVSADMYYYEGIGIAKALGLTTGVGDNKFEPEASITRQDMFVLTYRILQMQEAGLVEADESAINAFNDYAGIADYAKEGLASLVKNDLVKGYENSINPVGNATRAETAVFIYRLYNLLNK